MDQYLFFYLWPNQLLILVSLLVFKVPKPMYVYIQSYTVGLDVKVIETVN